MRTDPVEETIMDGVMDGMMDGVHTKAADSLVYTIDNHWAGAQLTVRREGASLAAQLVVFASGVPVVSCIDAPMTSATSHPG